MKLCSSAVRILLVSHYALKHSATAQSQECLDDLVTVNNALPDDLPEGPGVECDDGVPALVCTLDESSIQSQFVSACGNVGGKAYAVDISVDCTVAGGGSVLGIEEVQYDFMNQNVCVGTSCTSNDLDALGQTRLQETSDFTEGLLTDGLGTTFSCVASLDSIDETGTGGTEHWWIKRKCRCELEWLRRYCHWRVGKSACPGWLDLMDGTERQSLYYGRPVDATALITNQRKLHGDECVSCSL